VQIIPDAKLDQLKRKIEEVETGRLLYKGEAYLSRERTQQELRIQGGPPIHDHYLVFTWRRKPCRHLGGGTLTARLFNFKNRAHPPSLWFLETHILSIKESLLRSMAKPEAPNLFAGALRRFREQAGLTQAALAAKAGLSKSAVRSWEAGIQFPYPASALALASALAISIAQLRIPENNRAFRPQHGFDGVFRDGSGRVVGYNVKSAANQIDISAGRLNDYIKKLPQPFRQLFPTERLPSEPMLVPGTKSRFETAINPQNLETLRLAIAKMKHSGRRAGTLKTSEEICNQHGISNTGDRIKVRRLLTVLADNSQLNAELLPRKNSIGRRVFAWRFDATQLAQMLADRSLVDVAKEFASHGSSEALPSLERGQPTYSPGSIQEGNGREAAPSDDGTKPSGEYITANAAHALTGLSLSSLSKLCKEGGPVRFERPAPHRLRIHAGDLARYVMERNEAED
jgi:transcriptional regulator with XRE-family HTH domain